MGKEKPRVYRTGLLPFLQLRTILCWQAELWAIPPQLSIPDRC